MFTINLSLVVLFPGTIIEDGSQHYQCKRLFSLHKTVTPDGKVSYSDTERYYCREVSGSGFASFKCGLESRILDEMHPITMPYYPPTGKYVFSVRELLTDRKNGDYDTVHVMELEAPDGTIEKIDRYFADADVGWREIDFTEFAERAEADRWREMEEKNEGRDQERTNN